MHQGADTIKKRAKITFTLPCKFYSFFNSFRKFKNLKTVSARAEADILFLFHLGHSLLYSNNNEVALN